MNQYHDLIRAILTQGVHEENRTASDTIAMHSYQYKLDVGPESFPLLTTKKMDTFRWDSLRREIEWYLDGEAHISNLKEDTGIWNAWADENDMLETAYGRFWRRYPVPDPDAQLPGEAWVDGDSPWVNTEDRTTPDGDATEVYTFDQVQYVLDTLNGDNPNRSPNSRRLMISPWHPSNAAVSKLPPCHCFWGVNVIGDTLNLHLTQRSGDTGLGIPFNIACYVLLLLYLAERTGYEVGQFSHTIMNAHIYCGTGDRGAWYAEKAPELAERVAMAEDATDYRYIREWILNEAPVDEVAADPAAHNYGHDHVPGLLEQLARDPYDRPSVRVNDVPLAEFTMDDIELYDYESHDGLDFEVAE